LLQLAPLFWLSDAMPLNPFLTKIDIQITFCKAMVVPILTRNLDCNKKKQESKIKTAGMKYFSSVTGCARKDQVRNFKIRELLNIFNLSNKILKPRSQ
jgi:hypothetical protein